jgi:hypothetical protein
VRDADAVVEDDALEAVHVLFPANHPDGMGHKTTSEAAAAEMPEHHRERGRLERTAR